MRKRTGDWQDLLSAYAVAFDAKKVAVGFCAVVVTVLIMAVGCWLYAALGGPAQGVVALGTLDESPLLTRLTLGTCLTTAGGFLPFLNPFYGGLLHFVLSVLMWAGLLLAWTGAAGVISRLTALEYARDEIPTLAEARAAVKSRRMAYFLAPLMPLVVIVVLAVMCALGGVIASVPYIGRVLLVFPGWPLLVAVNVMIVFLAVMGILSFGLMMPAVSVDGKDAFESWSTAYSYVLWGLRRFLCYAALAGVIGLAAGLVVKALAELLIYCIVQSVNLGFVGSVAWITHRAGPDGRAIELLPVLGGWSGLFSQIMVALMLLVRALPAAYAFSYFFTASTIIFFLMRKDQDDIDVDELYEPAAEEPEAVAETAAPEEEQPEEAEPAEAEEAEEAQPEEAEEEE